MMGNSLWQLVVHSDSMTKVVLLLLLVMSIMCWTIFLYKCFALRLKRRQCDAMIAQLAPVKEEAQLSALLTRYQHSIAGYLVTQEYAYAQELLKRHGARLNTNDSALIREHAYATIDELMYQEESMLALLSTSAALSPLLGLFGTVWGLIHSFVRISEKQSADITTVAPGLAEALITTLAGLMVAIPALAMYNYLSSYSGIIEQRLTTLAHTCLHVVQRLFI